ncbi:MAG: HPP family protein [Pseudonocardia sp.]
MRVRDVMTSPVITVRPDTPVQAAAALLAAHGFTAAPVAGPDHRVVGIVTEADLVRGRIVPDGWTVEALPEAAVGGVMTPQPLTAGPGDDLADLVATMLDRGVRSVPVVEEGVLVGIVSRRDVLRCVARGELTGADVRHRRDNAR